MMLGNVMTPELKELSILKFVTVGFDCKASVNPNYVAPKENDINWIFIRQDANKAVS